MSLTPAQRHMGKVAEAGCVICRRLDRGLVPCQVHHVAEGSSKRSDFATVGLCLEHHDPMKSGSGLHGMGVATFCKIYRVPWEKEEGLLVWVNEDIARYALRDT